MRSPPALVKLVSVVIHDLPAELWCTIFDMTVDAEWTAVYPLFRHMIFPEADVLQRFRRQPFILAAVCRAWRTLALQYAQLWTRVVLDPRDIVTVLDTNPYKRYFDTLEERSCRSPTDLVVHLANERAVLNMLGPAIFRMAARARSVFLAGTIRHSWSPSFIEQITQHGGRNLQSFVLLSLGRLPMQHLAFFPDVCQLRTIEMDGLTLSWASLNLASVRKATIKRTSRQRTSIRDWRVLLAAMPNCTDMFLQIGGCEVPSTGTQLELKPIVAYGVRSLVISPSHDGAEAPHFRFPALQRVQLRFLGFDTLEKFIRHSLGASTPQNLTFISILNSFCSDSVAKALASVPTVEELELIGCGIANSFFPTMTNDLSILPRLQRFTWRQPRVDDDSHAPQFVEIGGLTHVGLEQGFLEFVKQRAAPPITGWELQSVCLVGWPGAWRSTSEEELMRKISEILAVGAS